MRDNKGRFLKGREETLDIKIKRMYSLEESWKNRKDYIADIVKENPYIHNTWRGIRFTQKGKRITNSEEWNDFRTFYNDVVKTYKKGLLFRRLDLKRNYSKDNFVWVTQQEAQLLKSQLIWLEYKGKRLTLSEWANELSLNFSGIRQRCYKREKHNYSIEEILFGRKKQRGSKTPKDYRKSNIRAKASKMISSYKVNDFKKNAPICDLTIDWVIDNIFKKDCIYCGDNKRVGCDRIDNTKGHTKDNVLPCCVECNTARGDNFTVEEMKIIGVTIKKVKDARNKKS